MSTPLRLAPFVLALFVVFWMVSELTGSYVPHIRSFISAIHPMSVGVIMSKTRQSGNPSLPEDNLASKQFYAWLIKFNNHDREELIEYHEENFPYDVASADIADVEREIQLSKGVGGFEIADVPSAAAEADQPSSSLEVVLRERRRFDFLRYARVKMEVDPSRPNHPVTKFVIGPTITPPKFIPPERKEEFGKALAPLTPSRREIVVNDLCDLVDKQYINPKLGDTMIQGLMANLKSGAYDNYTDSETFSKQLTDDMHSLSGDKHIRVQFAEPPPPRQDEGGDEPDDDPPKLKPYRLLEFLKEMNFGFGEPSTEFLENNETLGYLPINSFPPSSPDFALDYQDVRTEISTILSSIANTSALIIDLRRNGGGQPATVAFILSYFLDSNQAPILLNEFVTRNGTVTETYSTLPVSELPANASLFSARKPLFVLTSKQTISGGEEMAYDLQALKRANRIIGENETTAGAANPVTGVKFIAEAEFGKRWWVVGLPKVKPVNGVTGTSWEGTGVRSDVVVDGTEDARAVARKLAKEALGLEIAEGEEREEQRRLKEELKF